jgi:putative nucleotidyltransferase with HDIG domain
VPLLKKPQKDNASIRSQYEDHSNKFLDYVNSLGIEKTWFGRVLFIAEEKFRLRRLFLIIIFSFMLSLLITLNFDFAYKGYKQDDVASSDIKSPISFEFVDEVETSLKKKNAENSVPPVFDYDLNSYEPVIQGVYKSFREMRRLLGNKPWPRDEIDKDEKISDFLNNKEKFDQLLGTNQVPLKIFESLTEKRFSVLYENVIIRLLDKIAAKKIINDGHQYDDPDLKQIIVRVIERGGGGEEFPVQLKDVQQVFEAKNSVTLDNVHGSQFLNDKDKETIIKFTQKLIVPNLTPNKQESAVRKQKAREAIPPVILSIEKNQVVVSEGTAIQASHVRILDEISRRETTGQSDFESLILALFFVSVILVFFSFIRRFSLNKIKIAPKDLLIMGTVALVVVIISKFVLFLFVETMQDKFGSIPTTAYKYLLPVASGPMLVGLLVYSGEVVWLFTAFLSAALGFMMDMSFTYFIFASVGGIAAARGVFSCKKRNDIYMAGLRVGLVNLVIAILLTFLSAQLNQGIPLLRQIFWNGSAGFVSGLFSAFVAMTLIPLLETLFNCTTDVKLLELSNLNHPLLKDMSVNALGTYHHSLVVGSMIETAAESIGSNALLCRVAAYYHDIGKTDHANYFIENQRPGHNPHDQLSPHMSKTILIAHVKDGVELGMKYKLGKPIIDVIQQHHGTTLISFFYNRALENQNENIHEVTEEEFRYPGPKPQFKEAALCMLADSIEAAARVLDEPHPMRIRNLVKTIIQRKFMDGQLDECNLTLRDLSIIENCFVRVLIGIHHQRIDYPKNLGGVGKD